MWSKYKNKRKVEIYHVVNVTTTWLKYEHVVTFSSFLRLGLLCDKFISRFPKEVPPTEKCEIPLDDLARQMNTERRRIYDIVNVLEAVQVEWQSI